MFPLKAMDEISKILMGYTKRYIVDNKFDIYLEEIPNSIGICKAYVNNLKPFEGYNDFMIDEENASSIHKIKVKTLTEERDMDGNLVLSGATTLTDTANGYQAIETTLRCGGKIDYGDDIRGEFLRNVWGQISNMNFTPVNSDLSVNKKAFYELPISDNNGTCETLYISMDEFNITKTFIDMSAALIDKFHPYQDIDNHKRHVMLRLRYEPLTLYMLTAIVVE